MIAEYLDRPFVISQLRAQREFLVKLRRLIAKKDKATLASLKKNKIKPAQIALAIAELAKALAAAKKDKHHSDTAPFIPRDAVTCSLQAGLTQLAASKGKAQARVRAEPTPTTRRAGKSAATAKRVQTAARLELKQQQGVEIDPDEFSPSEPAAFSNESEDDDDDDDDDGDLAVKTDPDPPRNFFGDDDEHPLADNYRLLGLLSLDEVWFLNHHRGIACHLMMREPDLEIPDEKNGET